MNSKLYVHPSVLPHLLLSLPPCQILDGAKTPSSDPNVVAGRRLKIASSKKNWQEARKACQAEGGDLVVVDNPAVNQWLAKVDAKLGVIWIGATDEVGGVDC